MFTRLFRSCIYIRRISYKQDFPSNCGIDMNTGYLCSQPQFVAKNTQLLQTKPTTKQKMRNFYKKRTIKAKKGATATKNAQSNQKMRNCYKKNAQSNKKCATSMKNAESSPKETVCSTKITGPGFR